MTALAAFGLIQAAIAGAVARRFYVCGLGRDPLTIVIPGSLLALAAACLAIAGA